jgi:transposase
MSSKELAKALLTARTGRDPEEWLRELYVERGYSQREIAAAMGVSRDTIVRWIKEYGLERPPLEPLVAPAP